MANSLIVGGLKVWMEVAVACPEGYEPHPDVLAFAKSDPSFRFTLCRDPRQAAVGADVVFTDVWASMGQELSLIHIYHAEGGAHNGQHYGIFRTQRFIGGGDGTGGAHAAHQGQRAQTKAVERCV